MDELARAYVTLGVTPAATLGDVRKRYKALVRKWHPDRFARDPQGQAEASLRMRAINDAFRTIVASRAEPRIDPSGAPEAAATAYPRSPSFSGRRLTREEIDRMVETMKHDGPLDWLIDSPWLGGGGADMGRPLMAAFMAFGPAGACGMCAVLAGLPEGPVVIVAGAAWIVSWFYLRHRL